MLKAFSTLLIAFAVTFAGPAWSYDTAMAESYAELFCAG